MEVWRVGEWQSNESAGAADELEANRTPSQHTKPGSVGSDPSQPSSLKNEVQQLQIQLQLAEPAQKLRAGQLIAFPTETVYGLGANAWDETAVRRIFEAKGRPSDNPLIVHIADESQLSWVVQNPDDIPEAARRLMKAFWPGPLTIILQAHPKLAPAVHPGTDTVGVRMPSHPVALALITAAGCPVAAPSANSSGRPSPTDAGTVLHDLAHSIDGVIDGGPCLVGLESTVVAVGDREGVVYRPGWITPDELTAVAGIPFTLDPHLQGEATAPKSPGMKYRHYAPDAKVSVWFGRADEVASAVRDFAAQFAGQSGGQVSGWSTGELAQQRAAQNAVSHHHERRLALICPADFPDVDGLAARWSPDIHETYAEALSHELYSRLRWADEIGVDAVMIVGVEPVGRGLALMNRLQKASEGRVYRV